VPSQVAVASKDLSAGTVIRFDVGVGEEMGFEIRSLVEAARAHGTLVGALLHVQDLVYG
jgi:hypothetical protein